MSNYIGQKFGQYLLTQYLGGGGFADVYLGEHVLIRNKKAAIKLLKGAFTQENLEKLRDEAQRVEDLQHSNIVPLSNFGIEVINGQNIPFLEMEYASGGSLAQRHPRGNKVPLEFILSYVRQITSALQYAHDQKVIHRDVKPANFLLGKDGRVLLGDFGIAVNAHSTESMQIEDITGTPAYMAPEQFDGKPRIESDQYALSIVIYEWLCGEPPFNGPDLLLYALQHKTVPPPSLRAKVPTIPTAIEQVVLTALNKDPKQRFAKVQDFADALEQAYQEYKKEIAELRNKPEFTADDLSQEQVQQALLEWIMTDAQWWDKQGQEKISTLRRKGEKEADNTIVTALSALANRAREEAVDAVKHENYPIFIKMLQLMASSALPRHHSQLWMSLLQNLNNDENRTFIAKDMSIYFALLRLWAAVSPPVNVKLIRPWLTFTWLEFGTFLKLGLPDQWIDIALTALLNTTSATHIPSKIVQRIEQDSTQPIEQLFDQLLRVPQRQALAVRLFTKLVESGYTRKMALLHSLLNAKIKEQQAQQVIEMFLVSAHLSANERSEFLETYGKRCLLDSPQSPILLDHIRQYLQTLDIDVLDVPPSSFTSTMRSPIAFLWELSDFSQQLPSDIQAAVHGWCEIAAFIGQPTIEKAKLNALTTAIPLLPLEIQPKLIKALARALVSCIETEIHLVRITHTMHPVLKSGTFSLLYSMAEIAGRRNKQKRSETRFIPYIRFALEIENVYDIATSNPEHFIQVFLDSLLCDTTPATFRKLQGRIRDQNWPLTTLAKWNDYVSNLSKQNIRPFSVQGVAIPQESTPQPKSQPQEAIPVKVAALSEPLKASPGAFDAKEVLERIRREDIPSTWHVLHSSRTKIIKDSMLVGLCFGFLGGLIGLGISFAIVNPNSTSTNPTSMTPPIWLALLCIVFMFFLVGSIVGCLIWVFEKDDILIFMPEGFILTQGKTPYRVINYGEIVDIRSIKNSLKIRLIRKNWWIRKRSISLIYFESPEIIAQNIIDAHTHFKAVYGPYPAVYQ